MTTVTSNLGGARRVSAPVTIGAPELTNVPIDARTQRGMRAVFAELARELAGFPTQYSRDEYAPFDRFLLEAEFGGSIYSYVVFGLDEGEKSRAIARIKQLLPKHGIALNVLDGGGVISITPAAATKRLAVVNFAARVGVPPERVIKFGDQGGPTGNDRALLTDSRSFCVGDLPLSQLLPGVRRTNARAAEGVLEVINSWKKKDGPIEAIICDFDGTLTGAEELLDKKLCNRFKELLESGVKIAVATGRGRSVFDVFVKPLVDAGTSETGLRNLSVYMFNSGRGVGRNEWVFTKSATTRSW